MTGSQLQHLGRKVRERREALGMSVRQAAAAAGVTRATWTDVELGRRTHVRVRTLDSIDRALRQPLGTSAEALGMTVRDAPTERRITVVIEAKPGEAVEDTNAREQLMRYAISLRNYDVHRVLTYIDRLPPPPDIDEHVREAVRRALAELLTPEALSARMADFTTAAVTAAAQTAQHRKVS